MTILEERLWIFPKMFVLNTFVPWIDKYFQSVAQLLRIDMWNQQIQKKDHMCIAREDVEIFLIVFIFKTL